MKLTVAKADEKDFTLVWDFVHSLEALWDSRGFGDNWWDWPEDDDDYKLLRKIQRELECDEEDEEVVLEFVRRKFDKATFRGSLGRILFNCETLIENCCDPALDYIEFKPSIMYAERNAMEKVEKIIALGEKKGHSADKILTAIKSRIEESKTED